MPNYINRAEIKKKLEKKLTEDQREQARGDFHAWREKCVSMLPIVSGKDCSFACNYCYIQSMGFEFRPPQPLRLSGEQICYALIENKEFIPGKYGTPLAFGHISEPFLPELFENTLEYFKAITTYLGNPIQFSTKAEITPEMAKKIKGVLKNALAGPLVTITTLSHHKNLEPGAPTPEARFKSIANLTKAGYSVFLYLRPIIPGIVDKEIEEILKLAKKAGAVGVVGGGFRVTLPILNVMKSAKLDVSEIAKRIPNIDDKQRYIYTRDLEDKVMKVAKELKLVSVRSTKCALAYVCKIPSASLYWEYNKDICTKCKPCGEESPKFTKAEMNKIVKEVLGTEEIISVNQDKNSIQIKVKGVPMTKEEAMVNLWKPRVLETYFRKRISIYREVPKA
jgi:DNA repair photolyase